MPIYEYQCKDCKDDFELFFKSFNFTQDPVCPSCGSIEVGKKISRVTFKFGGSFDKSESDNYYSDASNIGKNVEASFSKHGVDMPDSVRKSIDDARGGKTPDGLDL